MYGQLMDSLVDILGRLEAAGYTSDFYARGRQIGCPDCEQLVDPATLVVDDLFRLEGDSDPDEEVLVYALSQGPCGRMGTYTIQFGPTITPDDEAVAAILRKQPHTNHPT